VCVMIIKYISVNVKTRLCQHSLAPKRLSAKWPAPNSPILDVYYRFDFVSVQHPINIYQSSQQLLGNVHAQKQLNGIIKFQKNLQLCAVDVINLSIFTKSLVG